MLGTFAIDDACVRLGRTGHEQRAAIVGRSRRDLEGPDALGDLDYLELVAADERTQNGDIDGGIDGGDVLEGLTGDLAK